MARHYFPDVYQNLEDGRYFIKANVAGTSYRQHSVVGCVEGQLLTLVRDGGNTHDRNATQIFAVGSRAGFVPRDVSEGFATHLDTARSLEARSRRWWEERWTHRSRAS